VQAEHLDLANLVFEAVRRALCLRGANKRNRSLQSEDQRCPRAAEDQITTRNLEHCHAPLVDPARQALVLRRVPAMFHPGQLRLFRADFRLVEGMLPQLRSC
jgi:hypothetical protein